MLVLFRMNDLIKREPEQMAKKLPTEQSKENIFDFVTSLVVDGECIKKCASIQHR